MPAERRPELPGEFALVGAGRAGLGLALCLAQAGLKPAGVASRRESSRRRARRLLPGCRTSRDPARAAAGASLVILGLPDDAVGPAAAELARAGSVAAGSLWVHLSGFHGLEPLAPVAACGGRPLAIHPLQTLPVPEAGPERLPGSWFTVVAGDGEWPAARRLVALVGGRPVRMDGDARPLYHAAAVLACNDLVALCDLAGRLLVQATGGRLPAAALMPLMRRTLDGVERLGPARALTGPVVRGDLRVVAGHLAALAGRAPWALAAYRLLGLETVGLAQRRGRPAARTLHALIRILGGSRRTSSSGAAGGGSFPIPLSMQPGRRV